MTRKGFAKLLILPLIVSLGVSVRCFLSGDEHGWLFYLVRPSWRQVVEWCVMFGTFSGCAAFMAQLPIYYLGKVWCENRRPDLMPWCITALSGIIICVALLGLLNKSVEPPFADVVDVYPNEEETHETESLKDYVEIGTLTGLWIALALFSVYFLLQADDETVP